MQGRDDFGYNCVSNIVIVNLNVFHMLIKSRFARDEGSGLIITRMGIGEGDEMHRASRNYQSYAISHAVSVIVRYSDYVLEHDTIFCFCDC